MNQVKLPIDLATTLLENKFKSLKEKSLTALTKQILHAADDNLNEFLKYIEEPDKYTYKNLGINSTVLCNLEEIWSNDVKTYLENINQIETINGVQHFSCKITDIQFLKHSYIQFEIEYNKNAEQKDTRIVSPNSLHSAELL